MGAGLPPPGHFTTSQPSGRPAGTHAQWVQEEGSAAQVARGGGQTEAHPALPRSAAERPPRRGWWPHNCTGLRTPPPGSPGSAHGLPPPATSRCSRPQAAPRGARRRRGAGGPWPHTPAPRASQPQPSPHEVLLQRPRWWAGLGKTHRTAQGPEGDTSLLPRPAGQLKPLADPTPWEQPPPSPPLAETPCSISRRSPDLQRRVLELAAGDSENARGPHTAQHPGPPHLWGPELRSGILSRGQDDATGPHSGSQTSPAQTLSLPTYTWIFLPSPCILRAQPLKLGLHPSKLHKIYGQNHPPTPAPLTMNRVPSPPSK